MKRRNSDRVYKLGQNYKCEFCPKTFSAPRWNNLHCNKDHSDLIKNTWFLCETCEFYFPTKFSLNDHSAQKHKRDPQKADTSKRTQCEFCQHVCYNVERYEKHALLHHPDEVSSHWPKCTECSRPIATSARLKRHLSIMHSIRSNKSRPVPERLQCPYCPSIVVHLRQHVAQFHPEQPPLHDIVKKKKSAPRQSRDACCDFCGLAFYSIQSFIYHANISHKPDLLRSQWESCQDCNMMFPTTESLKNHEKNSHVVLQHKCKFCPKECISVLVLKRHLFREHPGEAKKLKCPSCRLLFITDAELRDHFCNWKKTKFCQYCDFTTTIPGDLTRHCRAVHENFIKNSWLLCTHCNQFFMTEKNLQKHQKRVHKVFADSDDATTVTKSNSRKRKATFDADLPMAPQIELEIVDQANEFEDIEVLDYEPELIQSEHVFEFNTEIV